MAASDCKRESCSRTFLRSSLILISRCFKSDVSSDAASFKVCFFTESFRLLFFL